jgi:hypothetical protein
MHRTIILLFGSSLYYALSAWALYAFHAGSLVTALVLFGIPAYAFARYSAAPAAVLVAVCTLGGGMAILLEGIAHIYGIWYSLGVEELRLFGLVPIETIASLCIQTLFLALLYEFLFDDKSYSVSHARVRYLSLLGFALCALALIALHEYLVKGIFFAHSYLWIIGTLLASSLIALALYAPFSLKTVKRFGLFTLLAFVPLCVDLLIAVANTHKIFAYAADYLATVTIFGQTVPIEEFVLLFAYPLFVATFYELYLDDGRLQKDTTPAAPL